MAQWAQQCLCNASTQVQSPAWHLMLSYLWPASQLPLRSDPRPGPRTPYATGQPRKKERKKTNTKQKQKYSLWFISPNLISSKVMEDQATHSVLVKGQSRTTYFAGGKMRHREFWWCVTVTSEQDLKWGLPFSWKGWVGVVLNVDNGGSSYHLRNLGCRNK